VPGPREPQAETLELPILDKEDDSDEVDVGSFDLTIGDDEDEVPEHEVQDAFEVDIQLLTDSGSSEAASDLDVGVEDLLGSLPDSPAERDDDALPPATGEELDDHLEAPLGNDDPSSDAELGDDGLEALPELARDEGDEGPELEGTLLSAAPEGQLARGPSYAAEWLLLGTPCSALWSSADVVLGAAEHLMRFGPERRSDALPRGTHVTSLVLSDVNGVVMATTRGLLEQGADGSFTTLAPPEVARGSHGDVLELAAAPGTSGLWARLASGALVRRRGVDWERHETGGDVRCLRGQGSQLTLLVIARRPTLQLSSDAGSSFRELILPEPAAAVALGAAPTALARGALVVVADTERGLCLSSDGGETFRWVTGAVNVTAVTIGMHAGAPAIFAALHREARDVSELILVDPGTARALSIAELSAEADEDSEEIGRTTALVFENGYLWAAGGFGLVRLKSQ